MSPSRHTRWTWRGSHLAACVQRVPRANSNCCMGFHCNRSSKSAARSKSRYGSYVPYGRTGLPYRLKQIPRHPRLLGWFVRDLRRAWRDRGTEAEFGDGGKTSKRWNVFPPSPNSASVPQFTVWTSFTFLAKLPILCFQAKSPSSTGGSRGIGRAIVQALAREGAKSRVHVCSE